MTNSLMEQLFPRENRRRALVAFIRTFWQTTRGTYEVGGGLTLAVQASDLIDINWTGLALGAAAIAIVGIRAGWIAAGDVLANGLPYDRLNPTETDLA